MGQSTNYVRQTGFDRIQQEQMVINLVKAKGTIRRSDVIELCKISPRQASYLLSGLAKRGVLRRTGERRAAAYELGGGG